MPFCLLNLLIDFCQVHRFWVQLLLVVVKCICQGGPCKNWNWCLSWLIKLWYRYWVLYWLIWCKLVYAIRNSKNIWTFEKILSTRKTAKILKCMENSNKNNFKPFAYSYRSIIWTLTSLFLDGNHMLSFPAYFKTLNLYSLTFKLLGYSWRVTFTDLIFYFCTGLFLLLIQLHINQWKYFLSF